VRDGNLRFRSTEYTPTSYRPILEVTYKRQFNKLYYLKDHLGNIRVTVDASGVVKGYDDYYPFGLQMPGRCSNTSNPNHLYKYSGKELDEEIGLNWYYFGARYYDPEIARWMSVDPLAGKYPSLSPYVYCANNPLKYIDPNGKDIWERIDNWSYGKGWRNDNLSENWKEEDYKNATQQLADEQGVDRNTTEVLYEGSEKAAHFTTQQNSKSLIIMTEGGYEGVDEKNLNNARSSMNHEIGHANEGPDAISKAESNIKELIKFEIRAYERQKKENSFKNTTKTYKKNVELMEQDFNDKLEILEEDKNQERR